ncbi:hypothetical protein GWK47_024176 [Chionoecetes opilio]|uniref:Uncharacterized protein n=1 Tax=Chionoecetes opilio TaxID=41210 RepID=A0A8J4XMF1_CHIOP|nr:hypothetical protein GWK47_024176 [Chionoecetes opilio]
MKLLLGDKYSTFDPDFVKQLFYQRLPTATQNVLFCIKDNLDPDAIAKLAERLWATVPTQHVFFSVLSFDPGQTLSCLAHPAGIPLTTEQRRYRPATHTSTPPATLPLEKPGLCWYHDNFGSKASKCDPPCSYAA